MGRRFQVTFLLFLFGVSATTLARETKTDVEVTLAEGYDSNAYRLSQHSDGGVFTDLNFSASLRQSVGRKAGWFLAAAGAARFYGSGQSNADDQHGDVKLGMSVAPWGVKGPLIASFGAALSAQRSTFTDYETGAVYSVATDPPQDPAVEIAIPDRFDTDALSAFLKLSLRPKKKIRFFLNSAFDTTSYREDYATQTALDTLDHHELRLEPGCSFPLGSTLRARVSWVITEREYDDRPAVDVQGDPVPGSTREYDYSQLRMQLRFVPTRDWRFDFGYRGGDRQDRYAGYYDYTTSTQFVTALHQLWSTGRVELTLARSERDYETATVAEDPASDIRGGTDVRLSSRLRWKLHDHWSLITEVGHTDASNRDPLFAHDRTYSRVGFRFRK